MPCVAANTTASVTPSRSIARSSGERNRITSPRNSDPARRVVAAPSRSRGCAVALDGTAKVRMAASAAVPEVTHNTATGSRAATRIPAIAGPNSRATPASDSRRPISRAGSMPAALAIAGTIASRAVIPGTSPKELKTATTMNHPRLNPTVRSMIGRMSNATAEMTSERIAAVRRLIRSTSEPMRSPARAAGTAAAIATAPAPSGLPVVNSTSSGRAMPVTELPSNEVPNEVR